jgi:DNA-binding HxlR family transcriptional regulator
MEGKEYLRVLRSPARRAILAHLAAHGPSRFMDIKKATGLSTGVIYHHLRSLEGYITQDDNRLYRLTEGGMRLASYLSSQDEHGYIEKEETPVPVNDLLLEFYPTLVKVVSYVSLTQLYRNLDKPFIQFAVFIASLEFILLVGSHVPPTYSPVIGVYGYGVGGALVTFALSYFFIRMLRWVLGGFGLRTQDNSESPRNPTHTRLAKLVDPEILSMFTVGLAITYLSFLAGEAPLIGGALSLVVFIWGYVAIASAVSYTSGLEFIPCLLVPFAVDMFNSAVGQVLFEGYFQPMDAGFDLGMGALSIAIAAWADRSMKTVFSRKQSF